MKVVNVSSLKNNPTEALRKAHEDMVLVMNRDRPDALIVGEQGWRAGGAEREGGFGDSVVP